MVRWYARIRRWNPGKHRGFGVGSSRFCGAWPPAHAPGDEGTRPNPRGGAGLAVLLTAACLAGCGPAPSPPAEEGGPLTREVPVEAKPRLTEAEVPEGAEDRWLSWKDARDPIAWLESFDDSPAAGSPERRATLLDLIGQLDERYLEDPRMLANRTVQLRNMLEGIGVREDMLELLRGFAGLTRGVEGREDQFGEKVAFYVRLREGGASHQEALVQIETGRSAADREEVETDSPESGAAKKS